MPNPLTEKRAADRKIMLAGVVSLLTRLHIPYQDATAELLEICPRRVAVELLLPRGLRLTVDFDGESPQPDVYLLSWHIALGHRTCLSSVFDSVNNFHYQKATDIARGYERLLWMLESRCLAALDGSAYSPEREAEYRELYELGRLPWQSAGPKKTREEWAAIYEVNQ